VTSRSVAKAPVGKATESKRPAANFQFFMSSSQTRIELLKRYSWSL
jgi:hypothetical protein